MALVDDFRKRLSDGAFYETYVANKLACSGYYVGHHPVYISHEFDTKKPDLDIWVGDERYPVEVKSMAEHDKKGPLFVCSLYSFANKYGGIKYGEKWHKLPATYILIDRSLKMRVLLPGTKVFQYQHRDRKRGYDFTAVGADFSSWVRFHLLLEWLDAQKD